MSTATETLNREFPWTPQPEAAAVIHELLDEFCRQFPPARRLAERLLAETGTRLLDWVALFHVPEDTDIVSRLEQVGFEATRSGTGIVWQHPAGMFPAIIVGRSAKRALAVKVESVVDFLNAQSLDHDVLIQGEPLSAVRIAAAHRDDKHELSAIEQHGVRYHGDKDLFEDRPNVAAILRHQESFRRRTRNFADSAAGFACAAELVTRASDELGVDRTCDLFFEAEREYWQRRNRAARVQKARQDRLGMGWANHDHHTYRSSREHFSRLIGVLEMLGFQCRERFYGGREAGWGAQVLEQPNCGIVIFADVDLAAEEVTGDFAHDGLAPADKLGTVGLWCRLHGEAFLQAGLHHLECQFDYDVAREQLAREGVITMKPFTYFPHLKQAFTEGEIWPVDPRRSDAVLSDGLITSAQAEKFRTSGSLGSHLEILERNHGYKGFNQTGISEIILKTDPRHG